MPLLYDVQLDVQVGELSNIDRSTSQYHTISCVSIVSSIGKLLSDLPGLVINITDTLTEINQ